MGIHEAIAELRRETGMSQRELAEQVYIDRSQISRIENGKAEWPEEHDRFLARLNWKTALALIDERSGGYISNITKKIPNMDLHPAVLEDLLVKDMKEAIQHLGEIILAGHLKGEKQREQAQKTWMEIKDVVDKGVVMLGVLEEMFQLDRDDLIKKYELQIKKGER